MKTNGGLESIERLKKYGYTTFHIIGRLYLVRNYSKNYKHFSSYRLVRVKKKRKI